MPTHDFFARCCPATIRDVFLTMAEYRPENFPVCPCGNRMAQDLSAGRRGLLIEGGGFATYYNRSLGRWISSVKQHDDICKKMGVEPTGRVGGG